MKKLVIFDLDGTLLDTTLDINNCLNVALSEHKLPTLNVEQTLKNMGFGAKRLVELSCGDIEKELFEKVYKRYLYLLQNCTNELTYLYDGLDGVLKNLKKDGYMLAVVSNKPDEIVKDVCNQKLSEYNFDFIMGNNPELFKPKPDKSCLDYCLKKLNVLNTEAVYVGDSEVDVQTFLAADVDGIGVLWGFRDKKTLEEANCPRYANNALELYDEIKKL